MSDITFIGSGISSSFTILHFLDLIKKKKSKQKLKITIIDKYEEFHTGIPYGSRSSFSVLLITSLKNFLPEPELGKFIKWLNQNKDWLLEEFKRDGGSLSSDWISKNKFKIQENEWGNLFIPRRFFGSYINEKIKNNIADAQKKNVLEVDYITSEVIDIDKINNEYSLILASKETITSKKVVLSMGSLPVKHLWKQENLIEKDNLLFINNPYQPKLKEILKRVDEFLTKNSIKKVNALIVGANASGLEMLYKLNDLSELKSRIDQFVLLSTQGVSPDSVVDEEGKKRYVPLNLLALASEKELTAQDIADATYKDLDLADSINLGAASTVDVISKAFGSLLSKLNPKELKKFACLYGNEIGRRQRCAGYHYSKVIDVLKKEQRFKHIAGRFSDIKKNQVGEYELEYLETKSQSKKVYKDPFHIVINCIGSTSLIKKDIPELLKNLMNKGYCKPNESNIGFEVNDSLETSENLHIVGPLLAGNVFEGKAVWHVEHCGRIIWLSKVLSEKIHTNLLQEG